MADREKLRAELRQILEKPIFPHEGIDPIEAVTDYLLDTDVLPVVRCRDCKYSYFIRSVNGYECSRVSGPLRHGNDFCSYGEEVRNNG